MVSVGRAALGLHIGAAFGIERRLERDHAGAKTRDHRLDHGIAADPQRLRHDFGRQMAVAEVPGDAGQGQRVGGPDLRQRFGLGDHFHQAPVLEPQDRRRRAALSLPRGRAGIRARRRRSWRRAGDSVHRSRARPYLPERPTNGRPERLCQRAASLPFGFGRRPRSGDGGPLGPSLNETRSKRQPACKPGSVWPGLIAPT